jgi:hypothetical protein
MYIAPTFTPPIAPETRAPASMGMMSPSLERPIRRLKNNSTCLGLPTVKKPAFSRKKGRFSGKKMLPG